MRRSDIRAVLEDLLHHIWHDEHCRLTARPDSSSSSLYPAERINTTPRLPSRLETHAEGSPPGGGGGVPLLTHLDCSASRGDK